MNLTALATPQHDENDRLLARAANGQLTLGPVPANRPKPTTAKLRDACDAFNIRGTCRLVAYELLTYYQPGGRVFPSVQTIAAGLGMTPRVVQQHLARLERIGLWVRQARVGSTNLYELRLPGPVNEATGGGERSITPGVNVASPEVTKEVTTEVQKRSAGCRNLWAALYLSQLANSAQPRRGGRATPPGGQIALGGMVQAAPEPLSTVEPVRQAAQRDPTRNYCETAGCSNAWPKVYGDTCYQCDKVKRGTPRPRVPDTPRPTHTAISPSSETRLLAQGWHKGEGAWTRY